MINTKYYAGLVDSDGHIGIAVNKLADGRFSIRPQVSLSQLARRADPLHELAAAFNVSVHTKDAKGSWEAVDNMAVSGSTGERFLEQIKNHLVIKRPLCEYILGISGKVVEEPVLKAIKRIIKDIRNEVHPLTKNQPSAPWIAGYIDGDGCVSVKMKGNCLTTVLEVTSYHKDLAGVQLLQKAFGGSICNHGKKAVRWNLYLKESNCDAVLGKFIKHSRIKRTQLEYVKGYIGKGKHLLRKGGSLEANAKFKETLSRMKSAASTNCSDTLNA